MSHQSFVRPASWAVVLAFTLIYVSWGTTFLAIREGVHAQHLPPCLFGGTRVAAAGLILLVFLAFRGERLRFARSEYRWIALTSVLLFVGGNGLITAGERTVESGITSVLTSTTPLWLALLELLWPRGERLRLRGWLGLLVGFAGMLLLLLPKLRQSANVWSDPGPFMVLGSAVSWAFGSLVSRYHRPKGSHLAVAAYQMFLGGSSLALLGLLLGEGEQWATVELTGRAYFSFLYLLICGSLIGFVAFNWLLGHVSATLVGTYAYVNPVIAILIGWQLGGEELTTRIVCGMVIILAGVALVRTGGAPKPLVVPPLPRTVARGLTGFWNLSARTPSTVEEP
jgi:drug/metabolite transporter (DMT)-like permease